MSNERVSPLVPSPLPLLQEDNPTLQTYTALRLQHANPEHLHITSCRCFIGPIPDGWLKSRKHRLRISSYSSRTATFSASDNASGNGRSHGGVSKNTTYGYSFPQPLDAVDGEAAGESEDNIDHGFLDEGFAPRRTEDPKSKTIGKSTNILSSHGSLSTKPAQPPLEIRQQGKPSTSYAEASSFVTARETFVNDSTSANRQINHVSPLAVATTAEENTDFNQADAANISTDNSLARLGSSNNDELSRLGEASNSTSSLLPHDQARKSRSNHAFATNRTTPIASSRQERNNTVEAIDNGAVKAANPNALMTKLQQELPRGLRDTFEENLRRKKTRELISTGLVRFNIPDRLAQDEMRLKRRVAQFTDPIALAKFRKEKTKPGEIVKMDTMLVRVDFTVQEVSAEYDENTAQRTDSRVLETWREFVVVCRKSTDATADFVIHMYKTRVVPDIEKTYSQAKAAHEIALTRKASNINLYSSLDKTIVLWSSWKNGTRIFILRPRSSASSVEWYSFLRSASGWKRPNSLKVSIPDLNLTVELSNPLAGLESQGKYAQSSETPSTGQSIIKGDTAVATSVIQRCMEMLQDSPEWSSVTDEWLQKEKMGLAWKRYDRLEWVHGANEQKMFGVLAMNQSHDLELRPKQHYPTSVTERNAPKSIDEPMPVEGFLVRLTSQQGRETRFGKSFSKRLYFSTYNHLLCFCKPSKAVPPPPPSIHKSHGNKVPRASQLTKDIPLIYTVDPFPIENGNVAWLSGTNSVAEAAHNEDAYDEAERQVNTLLGADGYINLCHVDNVRNVHLAIWTVRSDLGNTQSIETEAPAGPDDGNSMAQEARSANSFELLLKNGLIVRLQAYDGRTKKEWMSRLGHLVKYWKLRIANDMLLYKQIRQANTEALGVDDETEAMLGQYAQKWEVNRAVASPQLFNVCGISCCRTVTMAGTLYRKPRMRSTFNRCGVVLSHGQLLIFSGPLRSTTGAEIPHIYHEREDVISLADTYVYSGLVTENDLLYQNRTFDSNHPGHHALPRVYLEDGWTSVDEDTATTFVVWQSRRRSIFLANAGDAEKGSSRRWTNLRYVSRLGVKGRGIVFKTRSRAERDQWVLNIGMEIERLQQGEQIRVARKG